MKKEERYEQRIRGIERRYRRRIETFMGRIEKELESRGLDAGPAYTMHDEEFTWELTCCPKGVSFKQAQENDEFVDVRFQISESLASGDGLEGINFSIEATSYGGKMLGGLTPHNYTPQVWVPVTDKEAIEERFHLIESSDINELANIIMKHLKG